MPAPGINVAAVHVLAHKTWLTLYFNPAFLVCPFRYEALVRLSLMYKEKSEQCPLAHGPE